MSPESDPGEDHHQFNNHGEAPDSNMLHTVRLAHEWLGRFPHIAKKYQRHLGTAAVGISLGVIIVETAIIIKLKLEGIDHNNVLEHLNEEDLQSAIGELSRKKAKPLVKKPIFRNPFRH